MPSYSMLALCKTQKRYVDYAIVSQQIVASRLNGHEFRNINDDWGKHLKVIDSDNLFILRGTDFYCMQTKLNTMFSDMREIAITAKHYSEVALSSNELPVCQDAYVHMCS